MIPPIVHAAKYDPEYNSIFLFALPSAFPVKLFMIAEYIFSSFLDWFSGSLSGSYHVSLCVACVFFISEVLKATKTDPGY